MHSSSIRSALCVLMWLASSCGCSGAMSRDGAPSEDVPDAGMEIALPMPGTAEALDESQATTTTGRVPFFENGRVTKWIDAAAGDATKTTIVLDVGDDFAPALFSETPEAPHPYRAAYLALARGKRLAQGPRRGRDGNLELYGILPATSVVRERLRAALDHECVTDGDREAMTLLEASATNAQGRSAAVRAVQAVLVCEGLLDEARQSGKLDGPTRAALASFERRHRIVGRGTLAGETLDALETASAVRAREAVIHVLVERVALSRGTIEPRLDEETREALVRAFGLDTPARTLAWLDSLSVSREDAPTARVAFTGPPLPDYYAADMDLEIEIDRGDVWYDFPFDAFGVRIPQPVEHAPTLTIFTRRGSDRIALASFPTTIGGWQEEIVGGVSSWKYKESPVGERVWTEIVSAPVWLPPPGTPPEDALVRTRGGYRLNTDITGPGYASAYGLVAAYHRRVLGTNADGTLRTGGDEGVRTHGSVSYHSIGRGNSHGCHRLLNPVAVRVMTFVLAHRVHERRGAAPIAYRGSFMVDGMPVAVEVDRGGYVFRLARPLPVVVTEGRILGTVQQPITLAIPQFDATRGGFVAPDGTRYVVDHGTVTIDPRTSLPPPQDLPGPTENTSSPASIAPNATAPVP